LNIFNIVLNPKDKVSKSGHVHWYSAYLNQLKLFYQSIHTELYTMFESIKEM